MADHFNEIYTSFYRKSFLFVKSYVHDDMVAEDIVSDSLIKIWEKMKQEETGPIAPLLFTILKNASLDHLKHEAVKHNAHRHISNYFTRELEIRISTLQSCNPEEVFSSEVKQIVRDTLSSLPEKTRQVFEMSRFEGKPYKEIAADLGISVKGIEYHISRAVGELRVALKDYLPLWFCILHGF
ncbi:RNA polymerase sigma-70 factor [Mariniphaga sediminis]|uniref:RNA polymerase sigma-70 factor n=1 Tax=Mariniphaga sediminis TaxID=1628158 RepID=A0A399D0B5_9BACT|nr:RNA polymerase sigma-70 factor [Mariniphaga sediminis]RIH64638.1 RNA polymerase sigma-70 factor [Mariniphaga sediminis]